MFTHRVYASFEDQIECIKDKEFDEDAQIVMDRVEEMKQLRGNHFKELHDDKSAEAKQVRDDIDAAVQAWKDQWYEELEKE